MKKLLLSLVFLMSGLAAAQNQTQGTKDSLRNVINRTRGKEKLEAYFQLTNLYYVEARDDQKRDTLFALYDRMDAEARLIYAHRNKGDDNRALDVAKEMYEHANAGQDNSGMRLAFYYMSDIYKQQRRFTEQEQCLRESIVLLQDGTSIHNILTGAYSKLGNCLAGQDKTGFIFSMIL